MNFFYKLSNNTIRLKLPIVIDIKGILFIPDDFRYIYNKALEWNCKYLVSIRSSSGLPLTKKGIPFPPINFVLVSSRLKLDNDDIINWSSLKVVLENIIRSSDLIKYDENISSNIGLYLVFIKIL